jgi:hypothetical protein
MLNPLNFILIIIKEITTISRQTYTIKYISSLKNNKLIKNKKINPHPRTITITNSKK